MDSIRIKNRRTWFRYSELRGGDAISFLEWFEGMSFPRAVEFLLDYHGGVWETRAPPPLPAPKETVPFALPPSNPDIARKCGVDYAIKRDRSSSPPKFLVFFKSRDADALTSAFNEYAGKKVRKASRPSVLQRLASFKELVKNTVVNREKRRELER